MKVVRAGVEVAAAEVCWFRAAEAEHPFRRWFAHGDVRCAAAGSTVELGSGLWNVFAKDARGLSSIPMLLDGDSPPSEATLALEPSAALRIALPETKRAVVYAPLLGVAVPMPSPVPAGQPLWVFVVEKSSPVALFPIAPLEPGTAREVDATGGGPPAVVAWLHVPESDRAMLAKESGLRAPAIHASADGKTSTSDALPRLAGLHGAMVRVPAVAPGNGELRIGGRGWVPQALAIRVEPGLALIDQPLTVRGAGTLIVRWSALSDLPALDASLGACESDPNAPVLELRVSSCPRPRPGEPLDTGGCTIIRQQTFESHLKFGAITVDELPPGLYRAELRYGKLPPVASSTTVGSLQQQAIGLIASYIEIYGSVTYGGEPIGE
ncbi:MAG TPA: hypothetical protein VFT12_09230, partial [Thermoanaerobaculia bacterium]|nr:hypothetical protein [Thermoanaerobaculia bacterium]